MASRSSVVGLAAGSYSAATTTGEFTETPLPWRGRIGDIVCRVDERNGGDACWNLLTKRGSPVSGSCAGTTALPRTNDKSRAMRPHDNIDCGRIGHAPGRRNHGRIGEKPTHRRDHYARRSASKEIWAGGGRTTGPGPRLFDSPGGEEQGFFATRSPQHAGKSGSGATRTFRCEGGARKCHLANPAVALFKPSTPIPDQRVN